jgi:hypothetical protein
VFLDDDDVPILVIDDGPLPAGVSEPQKAKTFLARSFVLRYDTAAVGAFLGAVVLGVSFMVGRATVGGGGASPQREGQVLAEETKQRAQETASAESNVGAPRSLSLSMTAPLSNEEPTPPPAPRPAPPPPPTPVQQTAAQADAETSEQPAAAATNEAKWWITVLSGGTKEGAEDVKKLLESKGLSVSLEKSGEKFFNVHVGAYADRRSAQCEKDLAAVKAIQYKGRTFHDAYVGAIKRAQ